VILPPRPAHALSGWYAVATRSTVTPLRPHRDAPPVILPPRIKKCDDAADNTTLPSQLDHEPCDCAMCDGTHRVVNAMGCERTCDYCACVPEVTP
jgi:hypothetical protein